MTTTIDIVPKEMEVRDNLIFILSHTDGLWPRTISTFDTRGAQILVNSLEEAMKWFKASNFVDCRINAYPKYTDFYVDRTGIAPTVLHVDIDKEQFRTVEEFELAVTITWTNFHNILGSSPTQLFTGGGIHFIQPQSVPVLERLTDFQKFDEPSRKFLHFEERLLTDGKCDQTHSSTVSFNSMLLRVPYTLNSSCFHFDEKGRIIDIPYEAKVRVVKCWDGNIPVIKKVLLMKYYNYRQFGAIKDILDQRIRERNRKCYGRAIEEIDLQNYGYIEKLFKKPIGNYRWDPCTWKIFLPYFINVKKLSFEETLNKINDWLDRCNSISKLNFDKRKVRYQINKVGTYFPPKQDSLERINKSFYELLKAEGIVNR